MTKPKPPGTPRLSSTGGAGPRNVDQSTWRTKVKTSRLKFDDNAKQKFLDEFAKTSRIEHSCQAAGIAWATLKHHRENDPEFNEAYEEARLAYRDRVHEHAERLIFKGVERPLLGGKFKDQIIATMIEYPIPLIQMELRRVDPAGYKDRQEVDVKGGGGVVVVPSDMSSDEWVKEQQEKNNQRIRPDENDPLK